MHAIPGLPMVVAIRLSIITAPLIVRKNLRNRLQSSDAGPTAPEPMIVKQNYARRLFTFGKNAGQRLLIPKPMGRMLPPDGHSGSMACQRARNEDTLTRRLGRWHLPAAKAFRLARNFC